MEILKRLGTIAIALAMLCCASPAKAELYPEVFEVLEINENSDSLTLINPYGFTWEASGIEDYAVGDCVAAIMYDNETQWIEDDIIVGINYAGFNFKDESAW